jgi:hypothetical protein
MGFPNEAEDVESASPILEPQTEILMSNKHSFLCSPCRFFIPLLTAVLLVSYASADEKSSEKTSAPVAPAVAPAPAPVPPVAPAVPATPTPPPAPASPVAVAPASTVIRIDAGSETNYTDSAGNIWLSDRGFDGGESSVREDSVQIEHTKDPGIYRTEHWGMSSFSQPLPNGKYVVKLHFAETYDGIEGPGGRVFSFNVEGQDFKDFDVWVKAGGPRRAYVEAVKVTITDGKLDITFESNVDNPEINGIEIIPAP